MMYGKWMCVKDMSKDEKVIKALTFAFKTCLIKTERNETKFALGKKQYVIEYL